MTRTAVIRIAGWVLALSSQPGIAAGPADLDAAAITVPADVETRRLGVFAGAGLLGSPGTAGGAFCMGLRLGLPPHVAASFDLGYGLTTAPPTIQDRWWVMPSVALALPAGPVRVDLGVGFGVGTSSGYVTWPAYAAKPFDPIWHFTVPAARAHAIVFWPLSPRVELFARLDVASLFIRGPQPGLGDSTWAALLLGFQSRLL
jgi:hypothetical protein